MTSVVGKLTFKVGAKVQVKRKAATVSMPR